MSHPLKSLVQDTLKKFNLSLTSYSYIQYLQQGIESKSAAAHDLAMLQEIPEQHLSQVMKAMPLSRSQLRQDLFVLSELDFKRNGFFVEFGAASGIDLSNTYLLEKEFGWKGILAEPARHWHTALKGNRSCQIETDCVWRESNATLTFNEANNREFSTIDTYSSSDLHGWERKNGSKYEVKTISLEDLLDKYQAPRKIDYLSIDTEGSEYEILSNFNFDKYQFQVITCEHNFASAREDIFSLLTKNGYIRKFDKISQFDDWYVLAG